MDYVPTTPDEQREMLRAVGVSTIEELLAPIPQKIRLRQPLNIPAGLPEPDVRRLVTGLANENADLDSYISFLGAGTYDHYVPSVVPHLAKRSEFYTSYTPYQAEVSQGMLQATYEYQTMICEITGMDAANASLYDGSTAVVEAALMAIGSDGRGEVLVSRGVDPQYRATLRTYAQARGFTVRELPLEDGATALSALEEALSPATKAVIVQHPNFFGTLEDMHAIEERVHKTKALFVSAFTEPAALGILEPPGAYNADIVAGEGQSLGNPMGYGGPALGIFATKDAFVRRMPGRLVGKTVDNRDQTGYVLTLQTREQHIRRERATSNICTNQALLALSATIYLAALGKSGFSELGAQCLRRAHYAEQRLRTVPGVAPVFSRPYFDEFALRVPLAPAQINSELSQRGILGGYDLTRDYPEMGQAMLFCVTEMRTREDIDILVTALEEIVGENA